MSQSQRFIKLHDRDERPVVFNLNEVSGVIADGEDHATIILPDRGDYFHVQESVDQIIALIEAPIDNPRPTSPMAPGTTVEGAFLWWDNVQKIWCGDVNQRASSVSFWTLPQPPAPPNHCQE